MMIQSRLGMAFSREAGALSVRNVVRSARLHQLILSLHVEASDEDPTMALARARSSADRAGGFGPSGRGFDSCRARHLILPTAVNPRGC